MTITKSIQDDHEAIVGRFRAFLQAHGKAPRTCRTYGDYVERMLRLRTGEEPITDALGRRYLEAVAEARATSLLKNPADHSGRVFHGLLAAWFLSLGLLLGFVASGYFISHDAQLRHAMHQKH